MEYDFPKMHESRLWLRDTNKGGYLTFLPQQLFISLGKLYEHLMLPALVGMKLMCFLAEKFCQVTFIHCSQVVFRHAENFHNLGHGYF